jgi:hypothetical protein
MSYISDSEAVVKRYITSDTIGRNPVEGMSDITDWLKQRGLTLQTIELLEGFRGTRQTRIHDWTSASYNHQADLTKFTQKSNRV